MLESSDGGGLSVAPIIEATTEELSLIRAMLFDLDGVLVQSEKLKAQAYAMAVQRIRGLAEPAPRAVEAYREIVGASREVAARFVIDQLGLEPDLQPFLNDGTKEPWEAADGGTDGYLQRHGR